jgi:hypothetical protein
MTQMHNEGLRQDEKSGKERGDTCNFVSASAEAAHENFHVQAIAKRTA